MKRRWMIDPTTQPGERVRMIRRPQLTYEHSGVPTTHAGITYRTKMEARWGAFFASMRLGLGL